MKNISSHEIVELRKQKERLMEELSNDKDI